MFQSVVSMAPGGLIPNYIGQSQRSEQRAYPPEAAPDDFHYRPWASSLPVHAIRRRSNRPQDCQAGGIIEIGDKILLT
jgi:hypothetical protein